MLPGYSGVGVEEDRKGLEKEGKDGKNPLVLDESVVPNMGLKKTKKNPKPILA